MRRAQLEFKTFHLSYRTITSVENFGQESANGQTEGRTDGQNCYMFGGEGPKTTSSGIRKKGVGQFRSRSLMFNVSL
jgi:hypothetical protein